VYECVSVFVCACVFICVCVCTWCELMRQGGVQRERAAARCWPHVLCMCV